MNDKKADRVTTCAALNDVGRQSALEELLKGRNTVPGDMLQLVDFLGMILDNVYSGIIVCDRNCRILFMNSVYGQLLGVDPRESVGKHIEEFFPNSRLSKVVSSGVPELGQRCSLKTEALLLVNRIPLRHDGEVSGVILQTIFRDYRHFTDLVKRLNLLEREVHFQKQAL